MTQKIAQTKKKILMLGTGGTIASMDLGHGLTPQIAPHALLSRIPQIDTFCDVDAVQLCNIDSMNMLPSHWLLIEDAIERAYDDYDGFVITHGTDTMAYTAAALSYLIQNSRKPIVLTGAQKPIDMEISDSKNNLLAAFLYAACDAASGVSIVFDGRVILGTRARKVRTKSFDAFTSINYPQLATIRDGRLLVYLRPPHANAPRFSRQLSERIALLKLIPGTDAELVSYLLKNNDAVIIESFGVGGLPRQTDPRYAKILQDAAAEGKIIVITTQVHLEGSDISVYQVGHGLKDNPAILEAYDMTTEAVVTKLMWIFGETKDPAEVRRMFYTPIAYDLIYPEEI